MCLVVGAQSFGGSTVREDRMKTLYACCTTLLVAAALSTIACSAEAPLTSLCDEVICEAAKNYLELNSTPEKRTKEIKEFDEKAAESQTGSAAYFHQKALDFFSDNRKTFENSTELAKLDKKVLKQACFFICLSKDPKKGYALPSKVREALLKPKIALYIACFVEDEQKKTAEAKKLADKSGVEVTDAKK